jgi:hypothetical protein
MPTPINDHANANGKPPAAKPRGGKRVFAPGATGRSRVTNGKQLFVDSTIAVDIKWQRRLRDIISLHTADLGGADIVSAAESSIIRRVATETVELELLEQRFAKKGTGASSEDLDLYARISNSLGRHLDRIGLKRVARDITPPTFEDIRAELDAEKAAREKQAEAAIGRSDATDAMDAAE